MWLALPRLLAGRADVWRRVTHHGWRTYVGTLALIGLITVFGLEVEQRIALTNVAMLLVSLLVVGLLTLTVEARELAATARRSQAAMAAMYGFSQALASTSDPDQIVAAAGRHIVETFHWKALLALPLGECLAARFRSPGFPWGRDEQRAAEWAFQHGEAAGHGTTSIGQASGYYLPLKTAWGIKGVLGVVCGENQSARPPHEDPLLGVFASRTALAIGRAILDETARHAELLRRSDKMQQALLNSVSHNFRTPLATITGALQTLLHDGAILDDATRHELLTNAREQAARLNRLVANLLDMTRLEAGVLHVKLELCDVADVIGAALGQLGEGARLRQITVDMPSEQLLVPLDFALISQVIVNLLDNSLKYSPADEPVEIRVRQDATELEIAVLDYGIGISEQDKGSLFERFQRGSRSPQAAGTGLGLSICRGFVEAHGGRIRAERREPRGTVVTFTVPMTEQRSDIGDAEDDRAGTARTRY